ncbi:MAG: TetR/AcrR family transcriptional regulator [Novosphingobium sp.]
MPLIVDHDERRRHIADVTARMIAQRGMDKVTLRDVAREAGYSGAIIGHYFEDKLHLLSFTSANGRARATTRVERALERGGDPVSALAEYLPLDEERQLEWQAWFGFWSKATSEPAIASERLNGVNESRQFIADVLTMAAGLGQIPGDTDCEHGATQVQVLLDGMACLVTMDPDHWPASRQREFFEAELRKMLGSSLSAAQRQPAGVR